MKRISLRPSYLPRAGQQLKFPHRSEWLLLTLALTLLVLLIAGAKAQAQTVNGDFESAPPGVGWTIDAPPTWIADGKVTFPSSGGNPTGYALIQSPFSDPTPLPHLPTEGCLRQEISCGSSSAGLCTISLQYKLDRVDTRVNSGRVRIRVDGVIRYVSPPTPKSSWDEITLTVPCSDRAPVILELCLQVDPGSQSWAARFDNVRVVTQKLNPEINAIGLSRGGEFVLRVEGREGRQYHVQASDDLVRWRRLFTGQIVDGSFNFTDAAGQTQRFYQVLEASNHLARIIDISPPAGSPGMTARVRVDRPLFDARTPILAFFGGHPAHARWIGAADEVEVQVPNIPAGLTQVTFRNAGFDFASGALFQVLVARSRQLVLAWAAGGECRLLSTEARGGEALSAAETDHLRLSFDVLNANRGLVYAGSLIHPIAGRLEVVDDSEKGESLLHATPNGRDATFALTVPNLPGPFTIQFYEAAVGLDLATEKGRSARRFVNEITVNP